MTAAGNATAVFLVDCAGTVTHSYDAATNTLTATVTVPESNTGAISIGFNGTSRGPVAPGVGGLTNVSVLQPGFVDPSSAPLFSPLFIDMISRFDLVRFLGWTMLNPDVVVNWSDRPLPSAPSWLVGAYGEVGPGVPWEVCIALCNQLRVDCWVNVPARASDDYIVSLARLLNATLDPELSVYVEYSNEVRGLPASGR
mgnify:CR=1 FL=1